METLSERMHPQPDLNMENYPLFNVVIVYEDFAAGKHAKETYDYLVRQLGTQYEFTNQMWKFDVLTNPKMQEMAVKDAVIADLIIISNHGGELPAEVRSWIDKWVVQKTNAMALVALVDRQDNEESSETASVRSYLQGVARLAGIGFFAQPRDWPERDDDFTIQQVSERAERTSTIMADYIQHNAPAFLPQAAMLSPVGSSRWGINE